MVVWLSGLKTTWPQSPLIYEIYPRSFFDTTGSGEGDLRGIIQKMPYIASLSVDAIWLAPFFMSLMKDGGYDVQDYFKIDERYGTLNDFKDLVKAAHDHDLLVMTDQVLNHTSDDHEWFQKSIHREDGYDDWYVWHDPQEDGSPPNNWASRFGPPAWTWNHIRQQYYFHQYLDFQPCLNFYNENVQEAVKKNIQHWKELGVDGFRFDAISSYLYDEKFRDNPPISDELKDQVDGEVFMPYAYQDHKHDLLPDKCHHVAHTMIQAVGEGLYSLGELTVNIRSLELLKEYTRKNGLKAAYTTDLRENGISLEIVTKILDEIGADHFDFAWWFFNHDQPRYNDEEKDREAFHKFLLMLTTIMPGPILFYQGQELGLPQPELEKHEVTDPYDLQFWPDGPGREGSRVPIPWTLSGDDHYGFTEGQPWLPMRWNKNLSVESQNDDEDSLLNFTRALLKARKKLNWGKVPVQHKTHHNQILELKWEGQNQKFTAYFNLDKESDIGALHDNQANIVFASHKNMHETYPPYSAVILKE
jgi:alpha-glucosidase